MRYLLTILLLVAYSVNICASDDGGEENVLDSHNIIQALIKEDVSESRSISLQYTHQIRSIARNFRIKADKWKSDKKLLKNLFHSVHQDFLHKYKPYDSFEALMTKGNYGCLSATTLYALILEELGFDYDIVELNFHIYLTVKSGEKLFLIESTDPTYGFISNQRRIAEKLQEYKEGNHADGANKYNYEVSLNNNITLRELIGLQYYNESVQAFNTGEIYEALELLNKAATYYSLQGLPSLLT